MYSPFGYSRFVRAAAARAGFCQKDASIKEPACSVHTQVSMICQFTLLYEL